MSWASRRQLKYFSIFTIFVATVIFAILAPTIFKKPTCSDGKRNGTEIGVDCGGSCIRACDTEIEKPVIVWSRAFPVTGSTYNLVAFAENRNKNSAAYSASYEFRIYDTDNKLIGRREGKTFIPPNQQFAVFESRFSAGQSEIKSVTFDFLPSIVWLKKEPTLQLLPIRVSNIVFNDNKDNPTLSAVISNNSIYDLPEFDVIAILYDAEDNAINASKTRKGKLSSNDSMPIVFTWPEVLSALPVTKDIIISINPFSVSF